MPPRKRTKKAASESEEPSSEFEPTGSDSDASSDDASFDESASDSDDGAAKKKKKPAAAAAAAKKKAAAAPKARATPAKRAAPKKAAAAAAAAAVKAEVKPEAEAAEEGPSPSPGKKSTPRKKKEFVPEEGDPWSYQPPSLIYRDFGTEPNRRIAAFDLDGTLVNTKSGAQFPKGADDWKLFNKKVVTKIRELAEGGYKIVIFSNQGGVKSALGGKAASNVKQRVEQIVAELDVPVQVFMATMDDEYRKPQLGMWQFMVVNSNGGVAPDVSQSFYCGDAAGRAAGEVGGTADFSDSDRAFAANLGMEFKVPEDVFGKLEGKKAIAPGAKAAALEALREGASANQALLDGLTEYYTACFELSRETGDDKMNWKGIAMRKAVTSLATFPGLITLGNLKEVQKLPAVGKGTIEKITEFLNTGTVAIPGVDPEEAAAKAAAKAAVTNKRQESAIAFL